MSIFEKKERKSAKAKKATAKGETPAAVTKEDLARAQAELNATEGKAEQAPKLAALRELQATYNRQKPVTPHKARG